MNAEWVALAGSLLAFAGTVAAAVFSRGKMQAEAENTIGQAYDRLSNQLQEERDAVRSERDKLAQELAERLTQLNELRQWQYQTSRLVTALETQVHNLEKENAILRERLHEMKQENAFLRTRFQELTGKTLDTGPLR